MRIAQGVDADVHDWARASLLAVVNPAYYGYYGVQQNLVVHAVFAVEGYGVAVMGGEQVARVYHRVGVAEEAEYALVCLLCRHACKALRRHLLVFLDHRLGYKELRLAVLPRVEERVAPQHAVFQHRLTHLERWVHQYAVVPVKHFCVHAAHRRAYD